MIERSVTAVEKLLRLVHVSSPSVRPSVRVCVQVYRRVDVCHNYREKVLRSSILGVLVCSVVAY